MAELVDARDLKSRGSFSRAGSIPASSTKTKILSKDRIFSLSAHNDIIFLAMEMKDNILAEKSIDFTARIIKNTAYFAFLVLIK